MIGTMEDGGNTSLSLKTSHKTTPEILCTTTPFQTSKGQRGEKKQLPRPLLRTHSSQKLNTNNFLDLPTLSPTRKQRTQQQGSSNSEFTTPSELDEERSNEPSPASRLRAKGRFIHAVKVVEALLLAISPSRKPLSSDATSFAILQAELGLQTVKLKRNLLFDRSYYAAQKETTLSTDAQYILRLPPEERTKEQINTAMVALKCCTETFSEFPLKMQKCFAQRSRYEIIKANRTVIKEGHIAENFYYILSGVVAVSTGHPAATVAFLKKGTSFGELALIHQRKRNASVICHTAAEVLTLWRDDFVDIFMPSNAGAEPDHIKFLRKINELKGWPIERIPYTDHSICFQTYFRRGVVICKDSRFCEHIYIIKSGFCKLLKMITYAKPVVKFVPKCWKDLSAIYTESKIEDEQDESDDGSITKETGVVIRNGGHGYCSSSSSPYGPSSIADGSGNEYDRDNRSRSMSRGPPWGRRNGLTTSTRAASIIGSIRNTPHKMMVEVRKLGANDIFGLEDVVFSETESPHSVSLVSQGAECVVISKKYFMDNMDTHVRMALLRKVRPLPEEGAICHQLDVGAHWQFYKRSLMKDALDHVTKSRVTSAPSTFRFSLRK